MSASHIKLPLLCLFTLMVAVACKAPSPPPAPPSLPAAPALPPVSSAERAQPVTTIELAHCFAVASRQAQPDEARCPAFISEAVASGMQTCGEVGGKLIPQAAPTVWALDVNGDKKPEYLFELSENVQCDGAPSVFSCGSLGCPVGIYEHRDGVWAGIGAVGAYAPEQIELLPGDGKAGYRNFRVCSGEAPCAEYAYYEWTGQGYEVPKLLVRGFWVDETGTEHGFVNIPPGTAVLATPAPDSAVLDRYADGAEVVIRGNAGEYFYVSPCNACKSGFVLKTTVRREQ